MKVDKLIDSVNPDDLEIAYELLKNISIDDVDEKSLGWMEFLFGKIYYKLGRWESALPHLLYPFEGREPTDYLKNWDLVNALFYIAHCFRKTGFSIKAEEFKKRAAKKKGILLKNEARHYFESKGWKISFMKSLGPKFKVDLLLEKRSLGKKRIALWFAKSEMEVEEIRFQAKEVSELIKDKYIILLNAYDRKDLQMISSPEGFKIVLSYGDIGIS
jgi:hypothetical protein